MSAKQKVGFRFRKGPPVLDEFKAMAEGPARRPQDRDGTIEKTLRLGVPISGYS
jgi:hypothetical protein